MKIKNVAISVEKFSFQHNHLEEGNYPFNPKLARETGELGNNKYFTKLLLKTNGSQDKDFPIDIDLEITAIFTLDDVQEKDNIKQFLSLQGVHILYPYLRSTVSSITTTAMVNPIVLPVVNALTLFDNPDTQNKSNQH